MGAQSFQDLQWSLRVDAGRGVGPVVELPVQWDTDASPLGDVRAFALPHSVDQGVWGRNVVSPDTNSLITAEQRDRGGEGGGRRGRRRRGNGQVFCLMRLVSSAIWLYSERRSAICWRILRSACITVVWSRPPNACPIRGSDRSVSSRHRYMAT